MTKSLALVALLLTLPHSALAADADDLVAIQANLRQAVSLLQTAYDRTRPLPAEQEALALEVAALNLQVDVTSVHPFVHLGANTWIETDLRPFGPIRIRVLPMIERLRAANPLELAFAIGHEIGHHLILKEGNASADSLDEQIANSYARRVEAWVRSLSPVPDLLELSLGTHRSPKQGCRDHLSVLAVDPWRGRVQVAVSTSASHCRIHLPYMKEVTAQYPLDFLFRSKFRLPSLFAFDSRQLSFECRAIRGGTTLCQDLNPLPEFRLCPRYSEKFPQEIAEQFRSTILFDPAHGMEAKFNWCVSEDSWKASVASAENIYSRSGTQVPLAPDESAALEHLNLGFGGGLQHQLLR